MHIGKFTVNSAHLSSNSGESNPTDCWVINVHTNMYIHVFEGINVHLNIHARPPHGNAQALLGQMLVSGTVEHHSQEHY